MTITIPQANPYAEYDELRLEINAAIQRTLDSGRYILGAEVAAFEKEFAEYIGVPFAVSVGSGTDALRIALWTLNVAEGDEVITVSHTAVATVAAIEACGAKPVLVDISPDTYTLDAGLLERKITPRTRVIIPVHIYGQSADLQPILEIAGRYGIQVLEDCAQAHGATYHNRKVGGWGDMAAFSFYPTKNLGAIGDGGMIVTRVESLADKARALREYGWRSRYVSDFPGTNSRLDELQAAILRVKLSHLDSSNCRRVALANEYDRLLEGRVVIPTRRPGSESVFHLYVVRHAERDRLQAYLRLNGIGTAIHYPVPIHLQPAYRSRLAAPGDLPVTEKIAGEILSLPLFPQLSLDLVSKVAKAIEEFHLAG
jgi:dTDP-4-amino-4,6-dideoxygalactose transaminase